jgi:hypothetical protein
MTEASWQIRFGYDPSGLVHVLVTRRFFGRRGTLGSDYNRGKPGSL